jgi:hypothetical protein
MLATPFIPSDIGELPANFPWRGIEYHIGPVEEVTPFIKWLGNKTTCGVQSLCAGTMLWGARRLERLTEVAHNFELAEAGFAVQIDGRYVDVEAGPLVKVPEFPPADSAMIGLNRHLRAALDPDSFQDSYYQPVMDLSHMVHIVRQIVGRIDAVAPKPSSPPIDYDDFESDEAYAGYNAPHHGPPLPPEVLNPAREYDPAEAPALVEAFRRRLDPARNRYLRSRNAMIALGFKGEPYAR